MTTPIDPADPFDPLDDLLNTRYAEIDAAADVLDDKITQILVERAREAVVHSVGSGPVNAAVATLQTADVRRRNRLVTATWVISSTVANAISNSATITDIGMVNPPARPPFTIYLLGAHANGTCQIIVQPDGLIRGRHWTGTQAAGALLRVSGAWLTTQPLP